MARGARSVAGYRLVDIASIPEEALQEIMDDANAGGNEYGLEVVEIVHNGPAQQPLYGVYTHNEEKWAMAQLEFSFTEEGVVEEELAEKAHAKAEEEAAKAKAAEDAELDKIGKGKK